MKVTFDHNCIIDALNDNPVGQAVRSIVKGGHFDCAVVNLGASEMRERGIRPNRYDLFEQLLVDAGMDHLERLDPMMMWDVTFWDRCVWGDDSMFALAKEIGEVLFVGGVGPSPSSGLDSLEGNKWLNRLCDAHTLWCHIHNAREVFVTSDKNFMKATKLPKLIRLGANQVCRPTALLDQ
jgi:hypothetical protein